MTAAAPSRLYLASRSPRRRELLNQIGVAFETLIFRGGAREDAEVDESVQPGEAPLAYVERVARAKATHGTALLGYRRLPARPVLSADTTLEFAGTVIGKPADAADAAAILHRLAGQTHRVLTAVALDWQGTTQAVVSVSAVTFGALTDADIRRYVLTGEPLDKAGAYGIQGRAGQFVARLEGSYSGVMGLPLYETRQLLNGIGFAA